MFERFEASPGELGHCTGSIPGGGRFTVYDQGAHITEFVPRPGADPVLYLSQKSFFEPQIAIRGGIPISFPWFANGRNENKSPAHGFARLARWQLLDGQESGGLTTLRWHLDESLIPRVEGVDPERNKFELTCTQVFGPELRITLRTRNTDDIPLVIEQALHTYYAVGDVRETTVHGLGGVDYLDKLTNRYDTQIGPVDFTGEVDRVYSTSGITEIHDPVLGRRIIVQTRNSDTTVVWNPGQENAEGTRDMGDDDWKRFVCVETANVRSRAIHLNPGQAHDLELSISVAEL